MMMSENKWFILAIIALVLYVFLYLIPFAHKTRKDVMYMDENNM